MGSTMQINTTEMKNICSTFNSKVSSIDLGSVDVAGSFEPFTSQGILTGYVSSLKDALTSISENCTNISSILNNLASTQEEIDNNGKDAADSNLFGNNSNGNNTGGRTGGGGGGTHSTGTDNGGSTVGLTSGSTETSELSSIASTSALESLLSILSTSPSTVTSEDRASYLKELLKLKLQASDDEELAEIIEAMDPTVLQQYLNQIYNGELAINDATVSVTYDILERISKEVNIELKNLLTEDNMDTIREKVEALSQDYINLFNSNDLRTELQQIYDGTNIEGKDDKFVSSVRTVVDLIAVNQNTTGDALLLEDSNTETLKTEIGKVTESLGQLRIMSTQSNEDFLKALENIFAIDTTGTTQEA